MSTMHLSDGEVGSKKKPEVIMYYNSRKVGVDTMDQLVRAYSTKRLPLGRQGHYFTTRWMSVL